MRILLFRTDPSIMNIKNYNSQEIGMAKAYIKQGHQCDIVYYAGGQGNREEFIDAGNGKQITLYWRHGFSIANNGFFPGINKLLAYYDIIQVSEYYFWGSWYTYWKYGKTKQVYIYQGVYDANNSRKFQLRCKIMDPFLLRKKLLLNTPVFTKSVLAEETIRSRGFQQVKTVGVGLDLAALNAHSEESDFSRKIRDEKSNHRYILYIGVMEDRRNILFLLEVLRYIADRMPAVRLIMIGNGQETYLEAVRSKIVELKLEQHICWTSALSQVQLKAVYEQADLFLLPSKYEIFGMVILESMALGVPVLSSVNGGSSTLIHRNENGVVVPNFDCAQWGDNALALLRDERKRQDIIVKAHETTDRDFSWDGIVREILDELQVNWKTNNR